MSLNGRGSKSQHTDKILTTIESKVGLTDNLAIRLGLVDGIVEFQYSGGLLSASTTETTMAEGLPANSIYLLTKPSSAQCAVASASADDTSAGTGLRTILIIYLDGNGDEQNEIVTLNGTTKVLTTATDMTAINLLIGLTAGSGGFNAGNIYIGLGSDTFTGGAPDTAIFHTMGADRNFSTCAQYTVPNGKVFFFNSFSNNSDSSGTKFITTRDRILQVGGLELYVNRHTFTSPIQASLSSVSGITAGTTVMTTVQASSGTITVAATWNGILQTL